MPGHRIYPANDEHGLSPAPGSVAKTYAGRPDDPELSLNSMIAMLTAMVDDEHPEAS